MACKWARGMKYRHRPVRPPMAIYPKWLGRLYYFYMLRQLRTALNPTCPAQSGPNEGDTIREILCPCADSRWPSVTDFYLPSPDENSCQISIVDHSNVAI